MGSRRQRALSTDEIVIKDWIKANRGVLTLIALQHGVSPQFVQSYAYGRGTTCQGHPVEKSLHEFGWPGIRRRNV